MFERRQNEPEYALLRNKSPRQVNQYGTPIDTVGDDHPLRKQAFQINDEEILEDNPNRFKQHGFFFNADNCIACHACEAACSEKNDNPPHLAFRSVGFIEGGTYPAYQRINISMACNHCDNPVCLKGCPTRAYTKFAEYGAVLQDPDICFGCGYCTWVCPYNAPQLDPVKGQVSKCNMCVDRLEVGLKPACAAACLGNALDFGVIEDIPENREQAKTEIPGFPRTDITHPNIRFQQTRTIQRDMLRVDSTPVKYHRNDEAGKYEPTLDPKHGFKRAWNVKKLLGSHENAHIAFTLLVQTVMGAFSWLFLSTLFAHLPGTKEHVLTSLQQHGAFPVTLFILLILMAIGLFKLNMHLGKPHRFYRGFYNLRLSPVSREIAGVSLFFAALAGYTLFSLLQWPLLQLLSGIMAMAGIGFGGYYMYKLYRIEARPFWNHINTAIAFFTTAMTMGSLLLLLIFNASEPLPAALNQALATVVMLSLVLEMLGLYWHRRDLQPAKSEGAASFYEQITTYGNSYWLRNILLVVATLSTLLILLAQDFSLLSFSLLAVLVISSQIISRALFYVLVIPTTMPGAFFWKNKGFVEHAREVGLADMQQLGVVYERHHPFKINELIDTIKNTTMKEKIDQFRRIFTG